MSNETTPGEVMRLVTQILPEAFGRSGKSRRVAMIAELMRRANDWGMTDARDMAVFCAITISLGRQFFDRPAWLAVAARVSRGELSWSEALNRAEIWE